MAKTSLGGLASAELRLNEICLDRFRRRPRLTECTEDLADGTAATFTWALFLLCSDPSTRCR